MRSISSVADRLLAMSPRPAQTLAMLAVLAFPAKAAGVRDPVLHWNDDQHSRTAAVELAPESGAPAGGEIAAASDASARNESGPRTERASARHAKAGSAGNQALALSLPALGEPVEGWQSPQPAPARLIQLSGTVAAALLQSSTVRSAMADLALSGAEVRIARSGYYPTLQSSAGTGGVDNVEAELLLSQPLYDFGRTRARVSQTGAGREAAEAALWAARERAAYEAATAFIAVKRTTELVEASEDNVHAHERVAELARIRTDGGVGDATEKGLASVRLGESVSAREDARGNLRIARNRYASKVGAEPPEVLGEVPGLPLLFRTEGSLEALVLQAPTVESARARERSALAGARAQKAELFPRLEAVAYARTYSHMDKVDTGIGIRLVGPTFTGLSSFDRVKAADLLAESARWQAETARRDVVLRIRDLIERTPTLEEQLAILEVQLKEALVLRDLYEDQFKLGRRSLVDFLNIQADIYRIARTRVNTLYDLFELQYAAAEGLGRLQVSLAVDNVREESP
jgi:outer membrane protein TolC